VNVAVNYRFSDSAPRSPFSPPPAPTGTVDARSGGYHHFEENGCLPQRPGQASRQSGELNARARQLRCARVRADNAAAAVGRINQIPMFIYLNVNSENRIVKARKMFSDERRFSAA